MPDRSTGTDACALTSTSRASSGGKDSSGGPPEEFSSFKKAFTPRERRGSVATSNGFSRPIFVVLIVFDLLRSPRFSWLDLGGTRRQVSPAQRFRRPQGKPTPVLMTIRCEYITRAIPCPFVPPPCTRRTSRASSRHAFQSVSHARRGLLPRAEARSPGLPWTQTMFQRHRSGREAAS